MSSPEYLAGMTTPMVHPDTKIPIAGAAALAARQKQAGGAVAMMNMHSSQALAAFAQLMQPQFDSLQKIILEQQRLLVQLAQQRPSANG